MIQLTFLVISGEKLFTDLGRAFDLFEEGKVIGFPQKLSMQIDIKSLLPEQYDQIILCIKDACIAMGKLVSLVHLYSILDGDKLTVNTWQIKPYINPDVRIVSNGETYFTLVCYLKQLGIQVEHTNDFYIKQK